MMDKIQYDKFWLPKDVRNIGFLFEYCDKVMQDLYDVNIDVEKFLTAFMKSNVRRKMEAGNPRLLSQSYIDTIDCFITAGCSGNYQQFKTNLETEDLGFSPFQRMWIGGMYVKIAYHFDIDFAEVVELLPLSQMSNHYQVGHEISDESYLDSVRHIFEPVS